VSDTPKRYRELSTSEYTVTSSIQGVKIIAGPAESEMIHTAEGSIESALASKAAADIGGHYWRPDILRLLVGRRPLGRLSDDAPVTENAPETVHAS